MDQTRQDIFAKLEAAIDKWSTELADAQSGLAREVARAKDLFQGREEPKTQAATPGAAVLTQASLDAFVEFFRENCEALRSMVGNLSRWEEAAARFHGDINSLDAALSHPPTPDKSLTDGLESLRARVEEVRERVAATPGPTAVVSQSFASLREQLERVQKTLSDSQEPSKRVQEEIKSLRAEIAELSKRPAAKVESDPRLTGQIENMSAELGLIREIVAGTPELDHGVVDEIRSLRAEVRRIQENTAQVAAMREHMEAMGQVFRAGMAQLDAQLAKGLSFTTAGKGGEVPAPSPQPVQEVVEVSADTDLRADIESLGHATAGPATVGEGSRPVVMPRPGKPFVPRFEAVGPDGSRRRLGEILLAAGVISETQLERALAAQENSPQKHLGSLLIEMGLTGEDVIAQTLACQLGLSYIKLDPESIAPEAIRLIRSRVALRHRCIPIEVKDGRVILAIANPLDLIALEDVERAAQMPVEPVVASNADIAAAIDWCYRPAETDM